MSILFVSFLLVFSVANAQKVKLTDGDFNALQGQSEVKLAFTYEDMQIGKMSEADYIEKKRAEAEKKEAGSGDKWEEKWNNDRSKQYEPKFEELFNKNVKDLIAGQELDDAAYTLIIATYFIEPGFNVGITRRPAYVIAKIHLVKTGSPDDILGTIEVIKSPGADGMGFDYDAAFRIQEGYAKMGKELGKFFSRKVL